MLAALCVACTADRTDAREQRSHGQADRGAMVTIEATRFERGCKPARDPSCGPDEQPAHVVSVARFRIDRTEVTREAFAACARAGGCTQPSRALDPRESPRRPVTEITWAQARDYCRWAGKRLPTEAEWELAARGTDGRIYPWGDVPPTCDRAWTHACGAEPADVGGRPLGASPFGLLDMAGNVDEWVDDLYAPYDRARPNDARQRVARGGAYDAWHSRSTARNALDPSYRDASLGFRCAAD